MAIAFVQHASNSAIFFSGQTSGSVTATFAGSTGAGNLLVACFSVAFSPKGGYSPTFTSIKTGTSVDNWTQALSVSNTTQTDAWQYYDFNAASGTAITVTIAFGTSASSDEITILLDTFEFSGVTTSSPLDKTHTGNNNAGTTSWSSGSTTTTANANEVWIGFAGLTSGSTTSLTVTGPASPWVNETTVASSYAETGVGTVPVYLKSGYDIVSSTGAAVYNGTTNNSAEYAAGIATYIAAATGVSVALTVAQVNIAAPAPTPKVSPSLPVAQVNINALAPKLGAGPLALSVAQVNVNARAPGPVAGPVQLTLAQVTVNAGSPGVGPLTLSLPVAQVNVSAPPLIIGKSFAITTAAVTVTAYPPAITRPGVLEDSIVPLMATGVYSNV